MKNTNEGLVQNIAGDLEKLETAEELGGVSITGPTQETGESALSDLPDDGRHQYQLEGVNVEVEVKRFGPENDTGLNDSAIIFFPGWGVTTEAKSTMAATKSFQTEIAKDSGSHVFSIDTRADHVITNSLQYEAEAVRQLIGQSGLKDKKLILAGHSQGGHEAANLVLLLQQQNPEIMISGLVLLDPTGLYEQKRRSLVRRFIGNAVGSFIANPSKEVLRAGNDIAQGVGSEMKRSKMDYLKRLKNEVSEMSQQIFGIEQINCPVVLIQGADDTVSSPGLTQQEAFKADYEKLNEESDANEILSSLFPVSSYVKWVKGEKLGHHDMPLYRGEQVAKVALYLLRRHNREKTE
jgi:pimeloyl-ACP methyl ester carboxylesterase